MMKALVVIRHAAISPRFGPDAAFRCAVMPASARGQLPWCLSYWEQRLQWKAGELFICDAEVILLEVSCPTSAVVLLAFAAAR